MDSNILFVQTQEIRNVIIETDAQGHNAITCKRDLKYNRLINNRNAVCILRKNIVIIRDREIKDTIIEADVHGNNTVKSFDEYVKEEIDDNSGDIFKGLLIKIRKKKDDQAEHLIDAYLTEKRESLQEKLKKATEFHKSGQFSKANELYESALDAIKYDSYPDEFMLDECDIFAIKFALVFNKIEMNDYSSFRSAEEVLLPLIEKYGAKFPSLYYYLAKVYYNLNNFTKAKTILENGLKVLKSLDHLTKLNWPGTKDKMIEKSTTNVLEFNMTQFLQQCKIFHKPDAKCYFTLCDKEERCIYFTSPIFKGYVSVKCTNKCNFTYHRPCWKKHLKFDNVKKPTNLIGRTCQTNDCMGFINQIIIFDESLQVISSLPGKSSRELNKGVKNGCKFTAPKIENKLTNEDKETKIYPTKQKIKTEIKSEKDEDSPTSVSDKQDVSSAVKVERAQVETEPQVAKMTEQKKFSFNTDAKEYVPSNQFPNFKLHNISISNNLIQVSEEDTQRNKIISSKLNSLAPEYFPPLRVIKMLEGNVVVKYCERATQSSEKYVEQAEYDSIKCDINILQEELFKSEENYNDLLSQYETLKVSTIKEKSDVSTETDTTTCDSCLDLYSNLKAKDELCTNIIQINEQLDLKIKELQQEVNELKNARIVDKEIFSRSEQKYLNSNKVLIQKVQELLEENDNVQKEFKKHRILMESNSNYNIPVLKKILLEQIGHCRNFYLSYITMFENKCKHMIWELEDLKTLTNAESLPSLAEVEENLNLWQQALNTIIKNHAMYLVFFENLFKKYSSDANQNVTAAAPLPALVPEPPSLILRHFKSFFFLTKRLEQELNRHMTNYYKMLSIPYPGVNPYGMASSPSPLQSGTESEKLELTKRLSIDLGEATKELVLDNKVAFLKPPPGFNCEPIRSNQKPTEVEMIEEQETENEETLTINSSSLDISYHSNPDNSQENLTNVEFQIVEVEPTTNSNQPVELFDEARALPVKQEKDNKPVVIGTDGLLYKLQQKYPLIPPRILQEAVISLREARGGLTGIDSKTMMIELKIIVNDLWKKERQKPGYRKIFKPEKSNPWTPINNNVLWKNHNPSGNCAICFEKMKESNSTQLSCQHVFHTKCIKTWLKTNGICPICRSYITLDDEFPPLK